MFGSQSKWRSHCKQFLWLLGLWAAGVGAVALVAALIRLSMTALGMRSP